jgi:SPP1 family predicted phage head-tail adaptor
MGYTSGMMKERVTILERESVAGDYGVGSGGYDYTEVVTLWASVAFSRGVKSMREGALDAYDTIMVRMRWNDIVNRDSFIRYDGRVYQIESLNRDYEENILQVTCSEVDTHDS